MDGQILCVANQLIEQLNIRDFRPSSVWWAEYIVRKGVSQRFPGPHLILIGWCEFTWDEVLLPWSLKENLDLEDWRHLLAASLIYSAKLRRKRVLGVAAAIASVVLLALVTLAILYFIWPSGSSLSLIVVLLGTAVLLLMGLPFVSPFLKSLRLQADKLAAEYVGKDSLMRVLRKIIDLHLSVADIGGWTISRSSLEERLAALARQDREQ